jgi:hypothetical protein
MTLEEKQAEMRARMKASKMAGREFRSESSNNQEQQSATYKSKVGINTCKTDAGEFNRGEV